MNLSKFEQFREHASGEGVLFYYEGEFTENITAAMGDAVKSRLDDEPEAQAKKRKIFSAFIEMAQNVAHYSTQMRSGGRGRAGGALAIGRQDGVYFVTSGNLVAHEYVARLREKLEPLRSMNLAEIKAAYKAQLRNEEHAKDEVSKGAGLGFLTVARDASAPIDYSIIETTENGGQAAYFFLRATI